MRTTKGFRHSIAGGEQRKRNGNHDEQGAPSDEMRMITGKTNYGIMGHASCAHELAAKNIDGKNILPRCLVPQFSGVKMDRYDSGQEGEDPGFLTRRLKKPRVRVIHRTWLKHAGFI